MAKIVTLKDNNNDIVYPITPVDAVFVDSNTTLDDELNDKADADLSNVASGAITGGKIANNTITSSNIDWTTLTSAIVSTTSSISVPAGKWLIFHQLGLNQVSATTAAVYIYKLTNLDSNNVTWAMPPVSGQNIFDLLTRFNVVTFNSATTCSLSAATSSNVAVTSNKWVAIPLFN